MMDGRRKPISLTPRTLTDAACAHVDQDRLIVARRVVQVGDTRLPRAIISRVASERPLVDVGQRQAPGVEDEGDGDDQQQAEGRKEEALDGGRQVTGEHGGHYKAAHRHPEAA
jgi:hypothetical protein